jgi:hypothetical protein
MKTRSMAEPDPARQEAYGGQKWPTALYFPTSTITPKSGNSEDKYSSGYSGYGS